MFERIKEEIKERGECRLGRYGSFWNRFAITKWRWEISLCKFKESWAIKLFFIWIRLWQPKTEPVDVMEKWGFGIDFGEHIHFSWRNSHRFFRTPFSRYNFRVEKLCVPGVYIDNKEAEEAAYMRFVYPYHYTLESGEVQNRIARVTVEKSLYTYHFFLCRWLKWPRFCKLWACIEFSDEVGEETGSWKGGCVACWFEIKPGETVAECLRRMELTRKF